ncbi:outer membrane protein assembly factor BamB family protein [Polystyrenella longa]|nr:PQQ-binding-like beta-propeller repeat protein [Polystyrenella longa]
MRPIRVHTYWMFLFLLGLASLWARAQFLEIPGCQTGNSLLAQLPEINPAPPSEVQRGIGEQQELIRKLDTGLQAFEAKDYANGFEIVQSILELDTDLLLDSKQFPQFTQVQPLSLKNIALQILNDLPTEARRVYELQLGTAAEAAYLQYENEPNPTRKLALLEELVRLYPQTASGRQAALQLGNQHFDRFNFPSAIRYYERANSSQLKTTERTRVQFRLAWAYLETGEHARAKSILEQIKTDFPEAQITFGGESIPVTQLSEEILKPTKTDASNSSTEELKDWSHNRGNLSRNVVATAQPRGEPLWQTDLLAAAFEARMDELAPARQIIRSLIRTTESQEQELIPVNEPLKIGPLLIMRTLAGVEAREQATGKLAWRDVQLDLEFERWVLNQAHPSEQVLANNRTTMENLLRSKLWTNARSQSLSSNGRQVFALDKVIPEEEPNQRVVIFGGTQQVERFNRLYALEASSGKVQWEIGGTRQFQVLPLAGYFFLGAPLCLEDKLYTLAISGSELLLLTLDADSGHLIRQQPLQQLSPLEVQELLLSNYELSPALLDQVLLCPTGNGLLFAYDLTEERWIWKTKYPSFSARFRPLDRSSAPSDADEILLPTEMNHPGGEAIPIAGDGHVAMAPPDSSVFFCINVATGEQNWTREQKDLVTLIGIENHRLLVLNRNSVESIHLVTGETVWKSKLDKTPSGRPLLANQLIHVPLSSGLILSLETENGRTRSQYVLKPLQARGVLLASEGQLYCQSEEFLVSFPTAATAKQQIDAVLESQPQSEEALYQQAHELLLSGEMAAGREALRQLNTKHDSQSARQLLIRLLKEDVQYDPDQADPAIEELLSLISTTDDSFSVLKLIVDRYVQREEYLRAFDAALAFIHSSESSRLPLVKLEKASLTPTLWFRSQMTDWYTQLDDSEKQTVQQKIEQLVESLLEDDQEGLSQLEQILRDLPASVFLQRRLVSQFNQELKELAEEEKSALRDRQQARYEFQRNFYLQELALNDPEQGAEWAYQYYEHLREKNEPQLALAWLDVIATHFKSLTVHGDQSGIDFARAQKEELEPGHTISRVFESVDLFDIQQYQTNSNLPNVLRTELTHYIDNSGPFTSYRYYWNASLHRLEVETRSQEPKWIFPFPQHSIQGVGRDRTSVFSSGPFLLVLLDGDLSVWKSRGPDETPIMLWSRSLIESLDASISTGLNKLTPWYDVPVPFAGPVIEDRIYYRIGDTLYSADVNTGKVLWQVKHVSDSALIFGKDSIIGLLSSDPRMERELTALNAITGEIINTIKPGSGEQPIAIMANQCVISGRQAGNRRIYSLSIETGEISWEYTFPGDAALDVVRDEEGDRLAVLDQEGQFHMIDLTSGKKIVDLKVNPTAQLKQIRLIAAEDQYLVLVEKEQANERNFSYSYNSDQLHPPFLVNAQCFAVNRRKKSLEWQRDFEEGMFYSHQIPDLPIILLTIKTKENLNPLRSSQTLNTAVLDRRTGKTLFEHQTLAANDKYTIDLNPDRKRIEFKFNDFTIRATPASAEVDTKPESDESKEIEDQQPE